MPSYTFDQECSGLDCEFCGPVDRWASAASRPIGPSWPAGDEAARLLAQVDWDNREAHRRWATEMSMRDLSDLPF